MQRISSNRNLIVTFLGVGIISLYAHFAIGKQIAISLLYVWYIILVLSVIIILLLFVYGIRVLITRWQIQIAEAQMAIAEATKARRHVVSFPQGEQVYQLGIDIDEANHALHLIPRSHFNGIVESATDQEMLIFTQYNNTLNQQNNYYSKQENNPIPLLENTSLLPLLPAVHNCDNILIVGGKGSGKTTLLQWLESERVRDSKIIVLDSHAQPSQWTGELIGIGREYGHIKNAMIALTNLLHTRYQSYSKGISNFEPISTIIDEFTLLPKSMKSLGYDIQDYTIPALTEGRKVKISCLWGIHSDRAKTLGLEGAKDLIECFDAVVYLKNVNNHRYAIIDFGGGKTEQHYEHPGPFVTQHRIASPQLPVSALPIEPVSFVVTPEVEPELNTPTDEEFAMIARFQEIQNGEKFSWNKATQVVFGEGKFGKNYKTKLLKILNKFDIDYQEQVSK